MAKVPEAAARPAMDGLTRKLVLEENGSVALQYAILASFIAAVVPGAIGLLGLAVPQLYQETMAKFPH